MPQIRCPNCGLTISLENRKETDMDLITSAVQARERTFTELLHITKLSRKTLSLRLKELRNSGDIVKNNGGYSLNGTPHPKGNGGSFMKSFSRAFQDRRVRSVVWVLMFLLASSASGYVLAMLFVGPQRPQTPEAPTVIGAFTMALDVNNVEDLHGWQVLVAYDFGELKLMEIIPGGFVGAEYPSPGMTDISEGLFMNATDIGENQFLLGGVLIGNGPGKDGSGRLATVVFGYFTDNYTLPSIANQGSAYETCLLNSVDSIIPVGGQTSLTFEVIS
jgi:hypothetical protein